MDNNLYNVLFLCTGNSARSVLAEAILNYLGKTHFKAFSAGSQPKGQVHPAAIKVLQKKASLPITFDLKVGMNSQLIRHQTWMSRLLFVTMQLLKYALYGQFIL